VGHEADNVDEMIEGRSAPKWSCPGHHMDAMRARVEDRLKDQPPTARARSDAARGHKRALAEVRSTDGQRLRAHESQSEIIDLTGLGGASASAAVRTAGAVAAVAQDDGASRQAARMLGAFTSDAQGQSGVAVRQPMSGALGTIELDGNRETAVEALQKALRSAPKYPAATRANQRRRNREAGLGGVGARAAEEMLGSSNSFFEVKGRDLKRAAQRYVCLREGSELASVKMALAALIGEGRVYAGASVTSSVLTCTHVCDELMARAASVGLEVSSVLVSLRQFIVKMRQGQEDLNCFFTDGAGHPISAGSASSE